MLNEIQTITILNQVIDRKKLYEIVSLFKQQEININILYDLSFSDKRQIAFHAAWSIEKIYETDIMVLDTIFPCLLTDFHRIPNSSVARHYGKLVAKILEMYQRNRVSSVVRKAVEMMKKDIVLEGALKWVLDKQTPIGTRMWHIEILLYFVETNSWLKDELIFFAQDLIMQQKPASINYGKRLLKKLSTI